MLRLAGTIGSSHSSTYDTHTSPYIRLKLTHVLAHIPDLVTFLSIILGAYMVGDSFDQRIQSFPTFDFWLSKVGSDRL